MDATRTLNNRRGIAVIYLAIVLFVLVGFAALVIDLGYMYVNRAKLQNAADAAALAGAGRIKIPDVFANMSARQAAKNYAGLNESTLNLSLNNTSNAETGDIVLGFFDPTTTPKFNRVPIQGTYSSINAVKVVARRNADLAVEGIVNPSAKYDMFLGKIFGWDKMGTKASAVAHRPPRARTYFIVSPLICDPSFDISLPLSPQLSNMAWTSLSADNSTDSRDIRENYFCPVDKLAFEEVCNKEIYTTGGEVNSVMQSVETDFYDLNYDPGMKTYAVDVNNNIYVTSWDVIVPISHETDPTVQSLTKQLVDGYAQLTIIKACGKGGGTPCSRNIKAPDIANCGNSDGIFLSKVKCRTCSESRFLFGAQPVLAE